MSHVRWTYGVASGAICILLVCLSGSWAAPDRIDSFTYWCGVATLVALVVAVGEVFHAGTATNAVSLALSASARQEARTLCIEIIALVDEVSERARKEDYTAALRATQIARRFTARLDFKHVLRDEGSEIATQLAKVEQLLQRAMTSDTRRPMNNSARTSLNDMLMRIKAAAEVLARQEAGV